MTESLNQASAVTDQNNKPTGAAKLPDDWLGLYVLLAWLSALGVCLALAEHIWSAAGFILVANCILFVSVHQDRAGVNQQADGSDCDAKSSIKSNTIIK